MQVLAVTPEIYPLIKTGGLADVTGALPIALALVIGFVLASRWIPPQHRKTIERAIAAVIYPAVILVWALQAYEHWSEGELVRAGLMVFAALAFVLIGARAILTGRLAPTGHDRG